MKKICQKSLVVIRWVKFSKKKAYFFFGKNKLTHITDSSFVFYNCHQNSQKYKQLFSQSIKIESIFRNYAHSQKANQIPDFLANKYRAF
jgi:hypothetical protein